MPSRCLSCLAFLTRRSPSHAAEEVKPSGNLGPYILGVVANILVAGMMRHVFVAAGVAGPLAAAVSGLGVGLFFAGSYIAINYAFARR